jgi:hypothetical protein
MARLLGQIRHAVENDRFLVSWHADEQFEDREVSPWQLVAGLNGARLVRERPRVASPTRQSSLVKSLRAGASWRRFGPGWPRAGGLG